jgi:hypothetical protein
MANLLIPVTGCLGNAICSFHAIARGYLCVRGLVGHCIGVRSMHLLGVNSATPRPGPDNAGIFSPHDIPYAISRHLSNYPFLRDFVGAWRAAGAPAWLAALGPRSSPAPGRRPDLAAGPRWAGSVRRPLNRCRSITWNCVQAPVMPRWNYQPIHVNFAPPVGQRSDNSGNCGRDRDASERDRRSAVSPAFRAAYNACHALPTPW